MDIEKIIEALQKGALNIHLDGGVSFTDVWGANGNKISLTVRRNDVTEAAKEVEAAAADIVANGGSYEPPWKQSNGPTAPPTDKNWTESAGTHKGADTGGTPQPTTQAPDQGPPTFCIVDRIVLSKIKEDGTITVQIYPILGKPFTANGKGGDYPEVTTNIHKATQWSAKFEHIFEIGELSLNLQYEQTLKILRGGLVMRGEDQIGHYDKDKWVVCHFTFGKEMPGDKKNQDGSPRRYKDFEKLTVESER